MLHEKSEKGANLIPYQTIQKLTGQVIMKQDQEKQVFYGLILKCPVLLFFVYFVLWSVGFSLCSFSLRGNNK